MGVGRSVGATAESDQAVQDNVEYPKYLLDDDTVVKVAEMGLGRGINFTGSDHQFFDFQIQPSKQVMEQSTIEAGYRQFRRDVRLWHELNDQMQASLHGPYTEAIKVDLGMSLGRNRSSRLMKHSEGELIHTRTIRFSIAKTQNIQVDYDQEEFTDSRMHPTLQYGKQGSVHTVDGDSRYGSDSEAVNESMRQQQQSNRVDVHYDASFDPNNASVAASAQPNASASGIMDPAASHGTLSAAQSGITSATDLITKQHKIDSSIASSSNQRLMADDDQSTTSQSIQMAPRVQLLIHQEEKKRQQQNVLIDDRNRVQISKRLIKTYNHGATHFISSIDLGAKVVKTKTTRKSKKLRSGRAHAQASVFGVGLKSNVSHKSLAVAAARDMNLSCMIDPRIKNMSANTIIQPDEERVIGYEVSPVWILVQDKKWQKAVKEGCQMYVKEALCRQPPAIGSGGPYLIKVGNYYLMLSTQTDQKRTIRGTEDVRQATRFYIYLPYQQLSDSNSDSDEFDDNHDPMKNGRSGFYIYCEDTHGQLYLTADSSHTHVALVTSIVSPNARGQFFLQYPSTQKFAALEQWPHNALLLVRKTAWFGRHQYLVMTEKKQLRALFGSDAFDDETQALCQFRIQQSQPEAPVHTGQTIQTDGETCDEL